MEQEVDKMAINIKVDQNDILNLVDDDDDDDCYEVPFPKKDCIIDLTSEENDNQNLNKCFVSGSIVDKVIDLTKEEIIDVTGNKFRTPSSALAKVSDGLYIVYPSSLGNLPIHRLNHLNIEGTKAVTNQEVMLKSKRKGERVQRRRKELEELEHPVKDETEFKRKLNGDENSKRKLDEKIGCKRIDVEVEEMETKLIESNDIQIEWKRKKSNHFEIKFGDESPIEIKEMPKEIKEIPKEIKVIPKEIQKELMKTIMEDDNDKGSQFIRKEEDNTARKMLEVLESERAKKKTPMMIIKRIDGPKIKHVKESEEIMQDKEWKKAFNVTTVEVSVDKGTKKEFWPKGNLAMGHGSREEATTNKITKKEITKGNLSLNSSGTWVPSRNEEIFEKKPPPNAPKKENTLVKCEICNEDIIEVEDDTEGVSKQGGKRLKKRKICSCEKVIPKKTRRIASKKKPKKKKVPTPGAKEQIPPSSQKNKGKKKQVQGSEEEKKKRAARKISEENYKKYLQEKRRLLKLLEANQVRVFFEDNQELQVLPAASKKNVENRVEAPPRLVNVYIENVLRHLSGSKMNIPMVPRQHTLENKLRSQSEDVEGAKPESHRFEEVFLENRFSHKYIYEDVATGPSTDPKKFAAESPIVTWKLIEDPKLLISGQETVSTKIDPEMYMDVNGQKYIMTEIKQMKSCPVEERKEEMGGDKTKEYVVCSRDIIKLTPVHGQEDPTSSLPSDKSEVLTDQEATPEGKSVNQKRTRTSKVKGRPRKNGKVKPGDEEWTIRNYLRKKNRPRSRNLKDPRTPETPPAVLVDVDKEDENDAENEDPLQVFKAKEDRKKPKLHRCPICDKSFTTQNFLSRHLRSHESRCPECNKSFPTKTTLQIHMSTHGLDRFACDICGQDFSRRSTLEGHIKVHAEDSSSSIENVN